MTALTTGTIGVSITAGNLTPSDLPPTRIGKQFFMGDAQELAIHITAPIARQWIQALTHVAEQDNNA